MDVAVLVVVAALVAPEGNAQRAGMLEAWGDLAEARSEVKAALGVPAQVPNALFVAACLAIEAGDLDGALARADELAQVWKGPQPQVLRALVQRRRDQPQEPLGAALVEAWKGVGRPELDDAGLTRHVWELPHPLTAAQIAAMTPGDRLLFLDDSPDFVDLALAAAGQAARNPRALDHEILTTLALDDSGRPEVEAALRAVAAALQASDPGNGYYALVAWLSTAPRDAPLAAADVETLERAADAARFEVPRTEMLGELRALVHRFDPAHADCRASLAARGLVAPLGLAVLRVDATEWQGAEGAALQKRAAAALRAVGRRLVQGKGLLERMAGVALIERGVKLAGDAQPTPGERQAIVDRGRYQREAAARDRLGVWPFATLCRDWSPDEVAYLERFVE